MIIPSKYRLPVAQLLVSIGIFEVFSALLLKANVRKIFPSYLSFNWDAKAYHGRGYPRYYLQNHDERGFDIKPNADKVTCNSPAEGGSYFIWGNSIGCFDNPPPVKKRYGVYLAGDSFTWGYTPFEKKFGTLLEKKIGMPVAKCGVAHTGQLHQFSKFKDITKELGYHPPIVVVNIFSNDADNDYMYPHSKIISGYQVEDVQWRAKSNKEIVVQRLGIDRLLKDYSEYLLKQKSKDNNFNWRLFDPRRFSATSALAGELTKRIYSVVKPAKVVKSAGNYYWVKAPYGVSRSQAKIEATYDPVAETSKKNLEAILKWLADSRSYGYRLIFSLIPEKTGYNYSGLKKFISNSGGEVYDFTDYIDKSPYSRNPEKLYWEIDGHFSPIGNSVYSEYLHGIITSGNGS